MSRFMGKFHHFDSIVLILMYNFVMHGLYVSSYIKYWALSEKYVMG
jgi:hypothetical protein